MRKKIKNAIMLVFTSLVLVSILNSCNKDNDDNNNPLIGKWAIERIVSTDIQNNTAHIMIFTTNKEKEYFTIEFKHDNNYSMIYPNANDSIGSGTYSLVGNEISIKPSTNFTNKATYSFSNNKLTLTFKSDDIERIETYLKL